MRSEALLDQVEVVQDARRRESLKRMVLFWAAVDLCEGWLISLNADGLAVPASREVAP